jgi:hypothetical protein
MKYFWLGYLQLVGDKKYNETRWGPLVLSYMLSSGTGNHQKECHPKILLYEFQITCL